MRIAVVSSTVFQLPIAGYGGLEALAWQQAKGLAAKGHQVALIAPDNSTCPGVQIIPMGEAGKTDEKTAYGKYWQFLPQFDAIVDNSWQKWSYSLKAEGRLKAPILAVCHAPIHTMLQSLPPSIDKPCFVCISDDQRAHFEGLFNHPARTAYNGIDTDFYKSLNVPRTNRFLFLARFSSIKGPDLGIDACIKSGVGLDLVGDMQITQEPEYFQKCKAQCDGKQIKMIGNASRGECVWWFSQAHVMLHPNLRFREPFGLAPVEAMSAGLPVVAWDNGAMRETIVDGVTGWLVRSEQELLDVVNRVKVGSMGITKEMRLACRERALLFSEQRMVNRYEELCREALETGGW